MAAAGGSTPPRTPLIGLGDNLRRTLLELRRAKSNVERLKLVGGLPAAVGVEIPPTANPHRTVDGEHAAITAKKMGIKRVDQDELAAASHRNMAAAYDRGFFDDLVTPFLGLYRDNNLRADSSAEKLAKLKPVFGVRNGDATMTAGNSTPLTDGASVALLASEDWAAAHSLQPLAYFVDAETAAVDYVNGPDGLLMAPTYAVPRLLARNGSACRTSTSTRSTRRSPRWYWPTCRPGSPRSTARERLGLDAALGSIDRTRLNVSSSSLAAGHPFAATGADRRPAGQAVGAEEGRDGCSGARIDLHLRGRGQGVTAILEA